MTPYRVVLSKLAQARFDEIIHASRKSGQQLARAIDRLALHPQLGESLKGQWQGYRKYRTGDYRIIYRVAHSQLIVYIITINNRKDVYR